MTADWSDKLTQAELDELYIQDMRRNMAWAYRIGERKPHYPMPAKLDYISIHANRVTVWINTRDDKWAFKYLTYR